MADNGVDRDEAVEVKTRVIEPEDIYTETRGHDTRILVVEDHLGQEFSDLAHNHLKVETEKQEYIGKRVELRYSVSREGYLNFEGFGDFTDEPLAENPVLELSNRDLSITRQSAVHDATRLVEGMIANGRFKAAKGRGGNEAYREEIKEEVKYWTDFFAAHHRNGKWPDEGENQ